MRPKLKDAALYFTDNGRVVCGQHAGMSARFTGRDISGQRVERVRASHAAEWPADLGPIACEDCGLVFTSKEGDHA